MKKLLNNKKYIVLAIILLIIIILGAVFIPTLLINQFIASYYYNGDKTIFISNNDIVKQENFIKGAEIKAKKFDLFNPTYNVFYKGENYKNLDKAVFADFIYLKRKNLIFWEVEKYETSYLPYYQNNDFTLDKAYDDIKKDVNDGVISHGVTPADEIASNISVEAIQESESVKSPDGKAVIKLNPSNKYGENSLSINNKPTKITNVTSIAWSNDSKYIVYSTGKYIEGLGELLPYNDIWVINVDGSNAKKLLSIENTPNLLSLYSDGQTIIYGTKDSVGKLNIDGTGNKIILNFEQPNKSTEEFILPEVQSIDSQYIYVNIPDKNYLKNSRFNKFQINKNDYLVKQL